MTCTSMKQNYNWEFGIRMFNGKKSEPPQQPIAHSFPLGHNGIQVVSEPFSHFITKNVKTPGIQREKISERVDQFYDTIVNHYKSIEKKKSTMTKRNEENVSLVPFLGIFTVASFDKTLQIVDGQHRFQSMYDFHKNYKNVSFNVAYILHECQNENDIKSLFGNHNNQYLLDPDTLDSLFTGARAKLKAHLLRYYPNHFKSTSFKPLFPNLRLDQFIADMMSTYHKETDDDGDELIAIVEKLNSQMGKGLRENDIKAYEKATQKDSFYLAYLSKEDKDNNQKIPNSLRIRLWELHFKDIENEGKCYCCQAPLYFSPSNQKSTPTTTTATTTTIRYLRRYNAGHVISRKHGGTGDINNLRPVCSFCNHSMGVRNMEDFKNEYYGSLQAIKIN